MKRATITRVIMLQKNGTRLLVPVHCPREKKGVCWERNKKTGNVKRCERFYAYHPANADCTNRLVGVPREVICLEGKYAGS